jgi:hypothetical protein
MLKTGRMHLELAADRFAAGAPIVLRDNLTQAEFRLESDCEAAHMAPLSIAGLPTGDYDVVAGDSIITTFRATEGGRQTVELPIPAGGRSTGIRISRKEPGAT